MYEWLNNNFGESKANKIMIIWYVILLFLIIRYSVKIPNGRFKYLEW